MNLSKLTKNMILIIGIAAAVFIAAGTAVCLYRSVPVFPFILGTVLGAAFTAFKLIMLERAVEKAVTMDGKTAGSYVRLQHLLRLFLTALILVLGAVTPFISLWGVAAGILTLQVSTFFIKFLIDKDDNQDERA